MSRTRQRFVWVPPDTVEWDTTVLYQGVGQHGHIFNSLKENA